jgi:hypothetical protein
MALLDTKTQEKSMRDNQAMKKTSRRVLATMLLCASACAYPQAAQTDCRKDDTPVCREVRESRCRMAVDAFLAQVADVATTKTDASAGHARAVAKAQEFRQRVADNRRNGVSECDTWTLLLKLAANS